MLLAHRPHYTQLHQGSRLSLDLPSVGYSTGHCIKSPGPQRVPRTCSYYTTKTFKAAAILSPKWICRLLSPTALISQTTEDGASNFHRGSGLRPVFTHHFHRSLSNHQRNTDGQHPALRSTSTHRGRKWAPLDVKGHSEALASAYQLGTKSQTPNFSNLISSRVVRTALSLRGDWQIR